MTDPTPDPERMTTEEMRERYDVQGFAMGMVVVRRKSDNALGSLMFDHAPRVYYGWEESK
jgi:hypothetical protein